MNFNINTMAPVSEITQKDVMKKLNYEKETGIFTWIKSGKKAGCLSETRGGKHKKYIRVLIWLNGKLYRASRLAWLYEYGEIPKYPVDHINGNSTDNRICNLRLAPGSSNHFNVGTRSDNTSGIKGVSYCKQTGKWGARLSVNGKHIWLGRFETKEDAEIRYTEVAKKMHGDFFHERIAEEKKNEKPA